ncbi:hypothetical protein P691DRAFT_788313 [Macrolepiota fuliginosa MF-IS2]|uniref:BTB domain-containing protein n=1 Tax=Macrolepiota fuliginosa MF-IS2 TaxID=1400762 RepID=A0A9P6BZ63_9AGAR|nr:hypothetical protein P691DRAFT_788313 [Macrolepiota fuliginosa MF-IS2]
MESQKSAGITSKISPPSITKDDKYYFRDGSIVILVEGRLFKIHQSLFERDSVLFQSSFSLSQDTSPDESGSTSLAGSSDDTPVVSNDRLADFRALCWAVYSRLLDEHSKESQGQFISSCSGWDDVRRLFSLAEQCGHKLLTQRIEEEWVHQISDGSPSGAGLDAFKQAVAVAEGSTKLRRFHGRVYYAYLRATGIFDAPSSADVAAYNLGYRPNSYGVGKYLSRLSDKQKVHMYQGLWSLSQFRNELVRAPGIPEELSYEVEDDIGRSKTSWKASK